jgi:hypothetical protein
LSADALQIEPGLKPFLREKGGAVRAFPGGAVVAFALCLLSSVGATAVSAEWRMDVESGVAFSGYNDVRIPGDTGTKFSLSEELEADAAAFVRLRVSHTFSGRHTFSALVAPLRIRSEGAVDRDLLFEGETFDAGTPLEAHYRFDSYRLSYRYDFHRGERVRAGVGLTAKIRDAAVSVEGGGKDSEKTNTGFVPLLNFRLRWQLGQDFQLVIDGDALAGPQGRAEDVLLAVRYWPTKKVALKLGYRVLEGGADVDEVYTFALVNYLVVGSVLTF